MPSPGFFITLLRVAVFPRVFFDERRPRLDAAARVVAGVAVLHSVLAVGLSWLAAVRLATVSGTTDLDGAVDLVGTATVGDGVAVGLLVIANWVIVGLLLHVVAWLFGSDGSVSETLFVVGWSLPVSLLSPLLAGIVIGLSRPESQPWDGPGDQLALLTGNAVAVSIFAAFIVLCWQGYIWIAGLQATHDVSRDTASEASVVTIVLVGLIISLVLTS